MSYFKANSHFTVKQTESMSHTFFHCHQFAIVLGACASHLRSLSVSREACAFPLTSVIIILCNVTFAKPTRGFVI